MGWRCASRRGRSSCPWWALAILLTLLWSSSSHAFGGHRIAKANSATALGASGRQKQQHASSSSSNAPADEGAVAKYKKLQNQSDIRGIAISGVSGEEVNLTEREAYCIGKAFGMWLREGCSETLKTVKVGVGMDCRLSGPSLGSALLAGLSACADVSVSNLGPCTTPATSVSCVTEGYDYTGAVMITASHLPSNRNGFKFFTAQGGLTKHDISELVALAATVDMEVGPAAIASAVETASHTQYPKVNFLEVYGKQLQDLITLGVGKTDKEPPLRGLKVVLNAGNGMGGFLAPLLEDLGAETRGSLNLRPDGTFPNHLANPELPEAMDVTISAVRENSADLGIVLDTDVDRSGIVDGSGRAINRNKLIALVSHMLLQEHPGTTIVTDSCSSTGLKAFIERRGGVHLRYKKGYANVIGKAAELNSQGVDCQLAMETSGHGAFKENRLLDDGAYLAMKVLIALARSGPNVLEDSIADLVEPVESVEFRLKVIDGSDTEYVYKQAIDRLRAAVDRVDSWQVDDPNYEGLRVTVASGGWILVRMSLHDPIVIFSVESDQSGGVKEAARHILNEVVCGMDETLDLKSLHEALN